MRAEDATPASVPRQALRFVLHLAAVYLIAEFAIAWLAGMWYRNVLPFAQGHEPTISSFQFLFDHLFAFSFWPGAIVGFTYSQWYRHRIAFFVWVVPFAVLAYNVITFPTSIFESRLAAAFHHYFGGDFQISGFRTYQELFQLAVTPDFHRGMDQLHFTGPLYVAIGYALAALAARYLHLPFLDRMKPTLAKSAVSK